ncbi:MAG: hypothetical protein IPK13_14900 [Deltaproteobacteria bacterium]|nr:hypothetical protein [Deltaproteobacteria bacterium]
MDLRFDLTMDMMEDMPTVRMDFRAVAPEANVKPSRSRTATAPKGWLYSLLRHPFLMPYNRLAVAVVLLNIGHLLFGGRDLSGGFMLGLTEANMLTAGFVNFIVAIIIRQPYVINLLFGLATRVPKTWPLGVRWALGKVYHFGGIHVGAFFSATIWLGLYESRLGQEHSDGQRWARGATVQARRLGGHRERRRPVRAPPSERRGIPAFGAIWDS